VTSVPLTEISDFCFLCLIAGIMVHGLNSVSFVKVMYVNFMILSHFHLPTILIAYLLKFFHNAVLLSQVSQNCILSLIYELFSFLLSISD
jgi:hypothetical protein